VIAGRITVSSTAYLRESSLGTTESAVVKMISQGENERRPPNAAPSIISILPSRPILCAIEPGSSRTVSDAKAPEEFPPGLLTWEHDPFVSLEV
jgi:hypothetical protein